MFTLKIKWMRFEKGGVVDETTLFIPADRVSVHAEVTDIDKMQAWEPGSFLDYTILGNNEKILTSRLIEVVKDEHSTWYLVSQAWVLGPTGSTIERVAP